jgi:hypothetical protein
MIEWKKLLRGVKHHSPTHCKNVIYYINKPRSVILVQQNVCIVFGLTDRGLNL